MYLLFTYYSNNRVESSNNELSSCWYALQMASLNFDDVSRGTDKKTDTHQSAILKDNSF